MFFKICTNCSQVFNETPEVYCTSCGGILVQRDGVPMDSSVVLPCIPQMSAIEALVMVYRQVEDLLKDGEMNVDTYERLTANIITSLKDIELKNAQ